MARSASSAAFASPLCIARWHRDRAVDRDATAAFVTIEGAIGCLEMSIEPQSGQAISPAIDCESKSALARNQLSNSCPGRTSQTILDHDPCTSDGAFELATTTSKSRSCVSDGIFRRT